MNIRRLLTVGAAAVAAAAAGFIAPGLAGATITGSGSTAPTAPSIQVPGLQIHAVNLHQQFEHALTQERKSVGPRAGIVPMAGQRGTATTTALIRPAASVATSCTEPNCPLPWQNGPVQHAPHVYLVLWGPNAAAAAGYLGAFFHGLGQTSYDSWSTVTSQYTDSTGYPGFGQPLLNPATDIVNDTSTPPSASSGGVTPTDLASEALGAASHFGITDTADAQIVVVAQSGTCFSDGFGGNCGQPQSSGYCGWHSAVTTGSTYLPFINLPWQPDAGFGCGADFVNAGSAGLNDGWSLVAGHEFAEAVTDPNPPTGYFDPADQNISGGEIADKCVWGGEPFGVNDPFGNVILPVGMNSQGQVVTHAFAMQSLWSNAANRCVMTTSPTLSVAVPGTQKSLLGKAVSLQIGVTTNTGLQTFKASGLPAGLSIGASTGKITGKPSVTAGTFHPKVTVSDYAKSVTISFAWQVSSPPGPIKGYGSKCVDDYAGHTTNGNKIDIWTCTGASQQRIVFDAHGWLVVVGKCITGGSTAYLEPCQVVSSQVWTRLSNGEYRLKLNGTCLTDPNHSTTNGTRLTLATCQNLTDQHWSLP